MDRITDNAYKCLSYRDYSSLRSSSDAQQKKNVYKKTNYFAETLTNFTARERVDIPEHVLQDIKKLLPSRELSTCSAVEVKSALKKLRLRKLYRHTWTIANLLSLDNAAVRLNHVEEDLLKYMFNRVHKAFYQVRGTRKNCLNYSYMIHQMLRLINRDDVCSNIPVLKTRFRVVEHDRLWEKICHMTGWEFMPLVPEKSRR